METVAFWFIAGVIVSGALLTVTLPNLLHAAVAFIGTLLGIAFLFLLMQQEFVAVTQILGYVGGVIVFVVFTILLTSRLGERSLPARPAGMIGSALLAFAALLAISGGALHLADAPSGPAPEVSLAALGARLLDPSASGFLVPFEVVSILLLTALIAAATVAMGRQGAAADEQEDQDGHWQAGVEPPTGLQVKPPAPKAAAPVLASTP